MDGDRERTVIYAVHSNAAEKVEILPYKNTICHMIGNICS